MKEDPKISRDSLLSGQMKQLAESRPGVIRVMPDDEREQRVAEAIATAPDKANFWVFAYGSLIWNPAINWDARHRCTVEGYHRSFCFWTMLGRGDENQPGLMLGLEPGGECTGVAYRIAAEALATELDILYRREMVSYAYQPTWTKAACLDQSGESVDALTFVVDPNTERFCGKLQQDTVAHTLSVAEGALGKNCDYLFQLVDHLDELDLQDNAMTQLAALVRQKQNTF